MTVYKVLCILRVLLVLWTQTGYVHPDEHFQGPEIVYGDIAEYDVLRTWEFTSSKPIRSIVFPYIMTGIPALVMRLVRYLQYDADIYLLLILPRLIMCLLSFLQDYCLYKTCVTMNLNYKPCLLLFSSSYVTFVYFTRTFTNSLESLFFAFLILLTCQILKLRDQFTKETRNIYYTQYIFYSFMCGATLCLGWFNRPTFICFSIFPTIIWCYQLLKMNTYTKINIFIAFFPGFFSINMSLIIIDTFYYNKVNYSSISSINNIIYTPLNFILYNLNSENLNNHGLHPRWLHLFINIPLLFSIYGILLPIYSLKICYIFIKKLNCTSDVLFLAYYFIPLLLLSFIPHQEPRFIIPLIVPLSLILGSVNFKNYRLFVYVWIISNILCLFFYGFIHQAGVYSSMQYISGRYNKNNAIIFYQTYMPPRYLLALEKDKNINVFDFAGCTYIDFKSGVQHAAIKSKPPKIFMVLPSNFHISSHTFENLSKLNYKLKHKVHIFPHLSTENLPELNQIEYIIQKKAPFFDKMNDLYKLFSIQILIYIYNH